jgi:hypothetical protein
MINVEGYSTVSDGFVDMAIRTADIEALRSQCTFQFLKKPIARRKTSHKENRRDFGLGGFTLFFDRLHNAFDGRFEEGSDVGSKKFQLARANVE